MNNDFIKYAVKSQGIRRSVLDDYVKEINDYKNMTRAVIEERPTNFREVDVFSRLIMDRIIFLGTEVDDNISNIIVAQLLFLSSTDSNTPISLYINSPGGSIHSGLSIYDTMQYISCEVHTICTGLAASMAAVILAGGTDKRRSALPHSRIMIHQPSGGMRGQAIEMEITVNHILSLKKDLYEILSKHTKQPYETIAKDSERDYWMKAEDAKNYGLIDNIITKVEQK